VCRECWPVCRLESLPVPALSHAQPVQQILPYLFHHRLYEQLGHLTACSMSCAAVRRIQRSELLSHNLVCLLPASFRDEITNVRYFDSHIHANSRTVCALGRCQLWCRRGEGGGGAARGGANIIIIIICGVRQANYCEGSRAVPACPSGKDRLETK
jgi:hypothetical protein